MVIGHFKTNSFSKNILSLICFVLLMYCQNISAQIFKLKNGVTMTQINSKNFPVLDKPIYTYNISVGVDYLETDSFFLNSELGYDQKGGKEKNPLVKGEFSNFQKKWSYVFFATTFRYKIPISDQFLFVGVGPKIDYLLNDQKDFTGTPYNNNYKLNRLNAGVKSEIGFIKDLDNIRLGLELSYILGINKIGGTDFNKLTSNPLSIGFSLGYKFK